MLKTGVQPGGMASWSREKVIFHFYPPLFGSHGEQGGGYFIWIVFIGIWMDEAALRSGLDACQMQAEDFS